MTLRDCPRAMRVVVDGIDLDERHRFRLCEIGLAPGAGLRVVQRGAFGGRVIAFGDERVAVDGATARAVRVRFAQNIRKTTLRNTKRTRICANDESTGPERWRLLQLAGRLLPALRSPCGDVREWRRA